AFTRRLDEFKRRILFVVGGQDPVVPIDAILEARPEQGTTLISLAEVRHFVTRDSAWNTWQALTVAAITRGAAIATSNCIERVQDGVGRQIGGLFVEGQRVQDDMAYCVKLLRAVGCEINTASQFADILSDPTKLTWLPNDIRSYMIELAASTNELTETTLQE